LAQVVRSVGQWSAGTTQIEGSIHNAYFSLIEKAEHFVYIEVCAFSFDLLNLKSESGVRHVFFSLTYFA
jgi:phosphatidylserine/phosphatidylglycerophosphate/cardiolipin synthase-like enzyme